jgi:uridylate kinase
MEKRNDPIIISLGGSIIIPNGEVDTAFLKKFRQTILKRVRRGQRFVIICGGGSLSRSFQKSAKALGMRKQNDLDWLGIHATRLNARLIQLAFDKNAHSEILTNPNAKISWQSPVIVGGGWKPGRSTDYVSVMMAKKLKAKTIINLSDIDYVYDKDPDKYKNAKKLAQVSWPDFKKLVGGKWVPGAHLPFDPIASRLAEKSKLKVVVMNGRKLGELEKALHGRSFHGSIIH